MRALLALALLAGCETMSSPSADDRAALWAAELPSLGPAPAPLRWPSADAPLLAPAIAYPRHFRRHRIYLDAGHGAKDNGGAESAFCEAEQDFTLRVALDLAKRLEATGHFAVRVSRKAGEEVGYRRRVRGAEAWGAEAFVSLHFDARGWARRWRTPEGLRCLREDDAPGFAVLWSDDAEEPLRGKRLELARDVARRMETTGFLPYGGWHYQSLYEPDAGEAGVFADRHLPGGRIYVLRRPAVPSVIIETHHALDVEEARRWREERTLAQFGDAVAGALVDFLGGAQAPLVASASIRP